MLGLLADENCEAHLAALLQVCRNTEWREMWAGVGASVHTFESLRLTRSLPDDELWMICQRDSYVLLTANRNQDRPTSLEATIRSRGTSNSLPVFTLADPARILKDSAYAERAAVQLMELLMDIDEMRGTGRLYLPRV
jgi:hypothetical protein